MWIDEQIIKKMPGSIASASGHRRTAWLKRAARMAIWEIREKVMRENGEDIFNVIVTAERVEVTVRGEIDTTNRDAGDKKPYWAERRER